MKFPEWIMFAALVVATGTALARGPEDAGDTQPETRLADVFERDGRLIARPEPVD